MATRSLGSLTLDLIAKIGGFQQGMDKAARIAANSAKRIEDESKRRAEGVRRAWQAVGGVIGAIGVAQIGRELIKLGDTYAQLNARIGLVSGSQGELDTALSSTFKIAQDSRQSFTETAALYVQLARSTDSLGKSQADTLAVTKAINQSLVVSGTSASSAAAALTQLGQGFAGGVLRGEELNSVLEQAPRLAQAIAQGLGVNIGQLRALGKEGKLTSEVVFDAILKSGAQLDAEFKKLPPTVDQAFTQIGNTVLRLVGLINEATGATAGIATFLAGAARGVDSFIDSFSTQEIVRVQSEVDTLQQRLIILSQTKSAEYPSVRLLQNQLDTALGTLKELKRQAASPVVFQNGAETARLLRSGSGSAAPNAGPDTSTLNGLREQLKSINALRDGAKVGSAEFARYNGQIKTLEATLASFNTTARGSRGGAGSRASDPAQQLLDSLRGQLEKTQDLTVAEATLRELQKAEFAKVNPLRKQEILDAAKLIDLATERAAQDKEAADAAKSFIDARRQAGIDEFEAIERANGAYQDLIASLIDATPTAALEKQRQTVQALSDEYLRGRFGVVGSQEAVEAYGETVNTFLGNVAEQVEKTKGIGEELGLTFTSAFEEAIAGGKSLRDVIGGLEQDIIKIITRKAVTEPLGEVVSSFANNLFKPSGGGGGGVGGFLSSALGSLFGGIPKFSVGTNYVPRDMLAMVHQGEKIVPAAQNRGGADGMTVVNNFTMQGPTDRRTETQIAAAAQRGIQRGARNL